MKRGFFFSFALMILFLASTLVVIAVNLSYQYLSSVNYYQKLIFYHYLSKSIDMALHDNAYDKSFESWLIADNKKICYIVVSKDKICLMNKQESKEKIIYSYNKN